MDKCSNYKVSVVHIRIIQAQPHKVHVCDYCHDVFESVTALKQHETAQHNGFDVQLVFLCPSCHVCLLTHIDLIHHLQDRHQMVAAVKDESSLCEYCGLTFPSTASLRTHTTHTHKSHHRLNFEYTPPQITVNDLAAMGLGRADSRIIFQVTDVALVGHKDMVVSEDVAGREIQGREVKESEKGNVGIENSKIEVMRDSERETWRLQGTKKEMGNFEDGHNEMQDNEKESVKMQENGKGSGQMHNNDKGTTEILGNEKGSGKKEESDKRSKELIVYTEMSKSDRERNTGASVKRIDVGIQACDNVASFRYDPKECSEMFRNTDTSDTLPVGNTDEENIDKSRLGTCNIDVEIIDDTFNYIDTEIISNTNTNTNNTDHTIITTNFDQIRQKDIAITPTEGLNTGNANENCTKKSNNNNGSSNLTCRESPQNKETIEVCCEDEKDITETILIWGSESEEMVSKVLSSSRIIQGRTEVVLGAKVEKNVCENMTVVKSNELKKESMREISMVLSSSGMKSLGRTEAESGDRDELDVHSVCKSVTSINTIELSEENSNGGIANVLRLSKISEKIETKSKATVKEDVCENMTSTSVTDTSEVIEVVEVQDSAWNMLLQKDEINPGQSVTVGTKNKINVCQPSPNECIRVVRGSFKEGIHEAHENHLAAEGIIVISCSDGDDDGGGGSSSSVSFSPASTGEGTSTKISDAVFSNRCEMERHKKRAHGVNVSCAQCPATFTSKHALRTHMLRKHTQGPGFSCQKCGKVFRSRGNLWSHGLTHLQPDQRRFPCPQCSHRFPTQHKLSIHLQTHDKLKQYQCGECAKSFVYRALLLRHLRKHIPRPHTPGSGEDGSVYVVVEEKPT